MKCTPQADKIVDYDAFMVETGLDKDTIEELYQVFHDEILEEREKLLSCYSGKDFEKLGKTVHNIKGISGSFKAGPVFEQSSLMNLDIKAGKYEGVESSLTSLVELIDRTAADIKRYFGK